MIVLPGGGYSTHEPHEAEPIAEWLEGVGLRASVFRYPLHARHPVPLEALRDEIRRRRESGADRIGIIGFSAGGHLAGLAALAPSGNEPESVDFVVMGYAITSMETETYRPSRIILLGEHSAPQLPRETSLDALVTRPRRRSSFGTPPRTSTSLQSTPTVSPGPSRPMKFRTPCTCSRMDRTASG